MHPKVSWTPDTIYWTQINSDSFHRMKAELIQNLKTRTSPWTLKTEGKKHNRNSFKCYRVRKIPNLEIDRKMPRNRIVINKGIPTTLILIVTLMEMLLEFRSEICWMTPTKFLWTWLTISKIINQSPITKTPTPDSSSNTKINFSTVAVKSMNTTIKAPKSLMLNSPKTIPNPSLPKTWPSKIADLLFPKAFKEDNSLIVHRKSKIPSILKIISSKTSSTPQFNQKSMTEPISEMSTLEILNKTLRWMRRKETTTCCLMFPREISKVQLLPETTKEIIKKTFKSLTTRLIKKMSIWKIMKSRSPCLYLKEELIMRTKLNNLSLESLKKCWYHH